jgi:hypothetical protein
VAPSAPPAGWHRAACRGANFCARMACPGAWLGKVWGLTGGDARRAKQPEGLLPSCNPSSNGRRPCRAREGSEKRKWHFVDVPPM